MRLRSPSIAIPLALGAVALVGWGGWQWLSWRRHSTTVLRASLADSGQSPLAGFAADVVRRAAHRQKLKIEWVQGQENVNLWPRLVPDEDPSGRRYLSEPWLTINYALVSLKTAAPKPRRVAHMARPYMSRLLTRSAPGAHSVPVSEPSQLLKLVCSGQADAGLVESRVIYALMFDGQTGCTQSFQVTPLRDAALPASVASSRDVSWAADRIREEIGHMSEDGSLGELHARWFHLASTETAGLDRLMEARREMRNYEIAAGVVGLLLAVLLVMMRRLKRAQQETARANEVKSRFVASVCHELRTPLSGMLGVSEMLADTRLSPEQAEMTRLLRTSAKSLLLLITDILDVTKVESGKIEMHPAPFRPAILLDEVVAVLAQRAKEKGLTLGQAVDSNLPLRLVGDEQRLRQILLNLAGNAVKFTEQGRVLIKVALVSSDEYSARVRFLVEDTGPGIPAAELNRILDEFQQGGAGLGKGGTGIGLTISRRLVELMGGTIEVSSEWGRGSTFSFTVPLGVCAALTPMPVPMPVRPNPASSPMRVLVCEDSLVNQKAIVHMLKRLNHRVDAVATAHAALQALEQNHYDLVLMDCHLPDMTGPETTRLLRSGDSHSARVPVVAVTASALEEDRDRCAESGMDAFLVKPISLENLAKVLDRFQPASGQSTLEIDPANLRKP